MFGETIYAAPMQRRSNHVLLSIKDQFRSARYVVRRSVAREGRNEGGYFELPLPIASVANAIITQAEAAASIFFSDGERLLESNVFPLPVTAYFGHPDEETAHGDAFTKSFYNGLKVLLRKFGARESLIHEEAIETARSELLLRHQDLIWDAIGAEDRPTGRESIIRLCAAITCAVAAQRPIKALDIDFGASTVPKHLLASPNRYCALVLGLATAIVSLNRNGERAEGETILVAADMTVDARFSKFGPALRTGRDPVSAITEAFSTVLPFLP